MKPSLLIILVCRLAAVALVSCNSSTRTMEEAGNKTDFFLGEWQRSEDAGQGVVMHRAWTFRADGTLEESGYPAWHATARYTIAASSPTTATLRLSGQAGEQADALPDELVLTSDPERRTLSVNGAGPFTNAGSAAAPPRF